MDDQITDTSKNPGTSKENSSGGQQLLETSKSDRHVWLMKCPPIVSRSLTRQQPPLTTPLDSSSAPIGAKVVVTVDPLLPDNDFSSTQLLGTESGRVPKCYSMDMSTDFIPMSVFSESKQGRLSVEGKIYHKFDMKPHNENIEEYGKLCREQMNKLQFLQADDFSFIRDSKTGVEYRIAYTRTPTPTPEPPPIVAQPMDEDTAQHGAAVAPCNHTAELAELKGMLLRVTTELEIQSKLIHALNEKTDEVYELTELNNVLFYAVDYVQAVKDADLAIVPISAPPEPSVTKDA